VAAASGSHLLQSVNAAGAGQSLPQQSPGALPPSRQRAGPSTILAPSIKEPPAPTPVSHPPPPHPSMASAVRDAAAARRGGGGRGALLVPAAGVLLSL
jgi:hypothetical protein